MADTAAVVERTSGAPGGGPMLEGDKFKEFASALSRQPPADPAPAPEDAAPSVTTEEAPAPAPEEQAAPPPAAPAPSPAELKKGPIPYERFDEVNQQLKAERQKATEYQQRFQGEVEERAKAQAAAKLFEIAEQNPSLAPLIFGTGPAPAPKPQRDPNAAPLTPEQQAIQEIRTQNAALMDWKKKTEQAAIMQGIQDRAEGQMETHPIFKNDAIRERAEEIIVKRILTQPQIPPEKIVDEVAAGFKAIEASIKEQYVQKKQAVVKSVSPGVGSGAPPAPPTNPPKKLKLSDGSALRALTAAMKGAQSQAE